MKNLIVLILTVFCIASLRAAPSSNPVLGTTLIDLTCTTNSNLTGLEIVDNQALTGRKANGDVITINCTVLSMIIGNEIEIFLSTTDDMNDVVLDADQNLDFVDVVTGTKSTHFIIITDIVLH